MISEVLTDLVEFFEERLGDGQQLEGWETVQRGIHNAEITADYPLIRVSFQGIPAPVPGYGTGRHSVSLAYRVEGEVASPTVNNEADDELAGLVWSADGTKGLAAALFDLCATGYQAAGRHWRWSIGDIDIQDSPDGEHYSKKVEVVVTATTKT